MAIKPEIYQDDETPFPSAPDFALVPGAASTVVRLLIVNNLTADATADTTKDLYLVPHQRLPGETEWYATGRRLVDARSYRMRAISGHGGLVVTDTATYPVGAGRPYKLPSMADGEGLLVDVWIVAPLDLEDVSLEHHFGFAMLGSVDLPKGLTAAAGAGVYLGLGDGRTTQVLTAGAVDAASTPDDTVTCTGVWGWQSAGVPHVDRDRVLTFDDQAADGALGVGEAYWALIHTSELGELEETRGDKGVDPVPETARPSLPDPAAQSPIAYVYVAHGVVIGPEDITPAWTLGAGQLTAVGLSASIGPSEGLAGDRWWSHDAKEAVTLAATTTSSVWRLPGGDVAVTTDGSRPEPDAVGLWEATTDAGAITALERRHHWLGRHRVVDFVFDEPLTGPLVRYAQVHTDTPLFLLPLAGSIAATVFDAGGGSSGASEWEIEYAEIGVPVAWTSVLDAGDRPSVPWDTTTRTHQAAVPAVCVLPRGPLLLRCRLVGELDASPPAGAIVSLPLWG